MSNSRVLPLEGVHNFRDYGGYAASGGGQVKTGLLWRSGQHFGATDEDLERIQALALATVIDLRGNSERASHPCRRPGEFAAQVLFHDGETSNVAPHERASDTMASAEAAQARMRAVYRRIPYNPAMVDVYRRFFAALAAADTASLVHCFAGKDRTGVAVALVHHILGVHPDDALEDYLLTNKASTMAILRDQAISRAPERWGRADEATLQALLGVDASYLAETFAEIGREHASVDRYLEQVLGIGETEREAIRAHFVE